VWSREVAPVSSTQTDRAGQLIGTLGLVALVFGVIRGGSAGGLVALLGADGPQLAGLAWRLLITGAGCGTVVASSTAVAVQSVTGPLTAMAGTANNVIRQLGGALAWPSSARCSRPGWPPGTPRSTSCAPA
jgi:hypothetical protein